VWHIRAKSAGLIENILKKKEVSGVVRPIELNHLSAGELREVSRINASAKLLARHLGIESERIAEAICRELQQTGEIQRFWHVTSRSALDIQGVDFICQTLSGYFLIDVKKSTAGVESFESDRARLQESGRSLHLVYPWRVTLDIGVRREEAKAELIMILGETPSFAGDNLPEYIKEELLHDERRVV